MSKRITINLATVNGLVVPQNAELVAPGLAVHPYYKNGYASRGYTLTHIPSGKSLGYFTLARKAREAALAFAPLANWTQDGAMLASLPSLRADIAVVRRRYW